MMVKMYLITHTSPYTFYVLPLSMMVKMYLITQYASFGFSLLFYKLHIIWIL